MSLEFIDRDSKSTSHINKPVIVAREGNRLPLLTEKVNRSQMEGIQGSDWFWERLQGPREHGRIQFNKSNTTDEGTYMVPMGLGEPPCVDSSPNLVFEQTAGNQGLLPKLFRRQAIFCQKVTKRNRRIEIDHRSSRSCSISLSKSRKIMIGFRGGGPPVGKTGGVIQPCRTASASKASVRSGLRLFWGGTSSATTRSRSVTSTVSPPAARRTYSLSLSLRTFNPTARIDINVASGSYYVKRSWDDGFWRTKS